MSALPSANVMSSVTRCSSNAADAPSLPFPFEYTSRVVVAARHKIRNPTERAHNVCAHCSGSIIINMFFRRVFARKSDTASIASTTDTNASTANDDDSSSDDKLQRHHRLPQIVNNTPLASTMSATSSPLSPAQADGAQQPQASSSSSSSRLLTVLQLTPLWEYIIRTRRLPDHLSTGELFAEFVERLRDPEWQVRQHALRVLLDVLAVLYQPSTPAGPTVDISGSAAAQREFAVLVRPLVENLGHAAPAIRRGALDVLRAHLTATRRPHAIVEQAIAVGMQPKPTQLPQRSDKSGVAATSAAADSRLCAGVMLALPAMVQSQQGADRAGVRRALAQMAVRALCERMSEITYQVRW